MELDRAYYHCTNCSQGFSPRDRDLGVEHSSVSPAVLRMIGAVGAMVSFEKGRAVLAELAGIDVTTK
ncbi:MAG: hypothetical protein ACK5AZ_26670 [Bryobacteraceae bacterium]